jgi:phosphoribosyl-ATP pyrophosphohydrolase
MTSEDILATQSAELVRTLSLLNDVYDALQENKLNEEALLVSNHLKRLSSPSFQSEIFMSGVDPILRKLAEEFVENNITA